MKLLMLFSLAGLSLLGFAANAHAERNSRPASAVTFTVNSTLDEEDAAPGNGKCKSTPSRKCTLRAAIMENNASGGGRVIVVPQGTYFLTHKDPAEPSEDTGARGDLDILAPVNLKGAGNSKTIIDGDHRDRVLDIFNRTKISRVTIQHGLTSENGGGIKVETDGKLKLKNSIVSENQAANGSGIYGDSINNGGTIIKGSSIWYNLCANKGSGIVFNYGGAVYKSRIAFNCASGNDVAGQGGGIFAIDKADVGNALIVQASTIDHNMAREGGGIYTLTGGYTLNSTIANNFATLGPGKTGEGGGVYDASFLEDYSFYYTTIASNSAGVGGNGGGIYVPPGATARLLATILDYNLVNLAQDDCEGNFTLLHHNLINAPNGCTLSNDPSTQTGIHADLMNLANNGGPTPTMALQPGSEAIDAIPPASCTFSGPLTVDQRGETRPADGDGNGNKKCDIGAFEEQP